MIIVIGSNKVAAIGDVGNVELAGISHYGFLNKFTR